MLKIHNFSQKGCVADKNIWECCGKRGQRAFELAFFKFANCARLCD